MSEENLDKSKQVKIMISLEEKINDKLVETLSNSMRGTLSKAKAIELIVEEFLNQDEVYQSTILKALGGSNVYSRIVNYTFRLAQGDHYFNRKRYPESAEIYEELYNATIQDDNILNDSINTWCSYRLGFIYLDLAIERRKKAIEEGELSDLENYRISLKCIEESLMHNVKITETKNENIKGGLMETMARFNIACGLSLKTQYNLEYMGLHNETSLNPDEILKQLAENPNSSKTAVAIFEATPITKSYFNQIVTDCDNALTYLRGLADKGQDMNREALRPLPSLSRLSNLMSDDLDLEFLRSSKRFQERFIEIKEIAISNWNIKEWFRKKFNI